MNNLIYCEVVVKFYTGILVLYIFPISLVLLFVRDRYYIIKINLVIKLLSFFGFLAFNFFVFCQKNEVYDTFLSFLNFYPVYVDNISVLIDFLLSLLFIYFISVRKLKFKYQSIEFYLYVLISFITYALIFFYPERDVFAPPYSHSETNIFP